MSAREHPFTGVVAIDGPAGTGKSTAARTLAQKLGVRYLDTGAMYRAATLAVLRAEADPDDPAQVIPVVLAATIRVGTDPDILGVELDGEPVDDHIRSPEVTGAVSAVSAVPAVRTALVAQQRRIIGHGGIVVEGRDIGTVVWPQARPKVLLTADPDVRARRRAEQVGTDVEHVADAMAHRDRLDSSRATSPLAKAEDAVELDTSELDVDEVVEQLYAMALET